MSEKTLRERIWDLVETLTPQGRERAKAREDAKALWANTREEAIQSIAKHLLHARLFGHNPNEVLHEAAGFYEQLCDGQASLDIAWLENRKEFPTNRHPGQMTTEGIREVRAARALLRTRRSMKRGSTKRREEAIDEDQQQDQEQ
jgi:hypothetical protein